MVVDEPDTSARRGLPVLVPLLLSLVACTTAPTIRPAGSPVAFVVVASVNGPATATVALTDTSGLVAGITSVDRVDRTTLGLTDNDWQILSARDGLVVGVKDSNDIGLLWNSGVCYPDQTVHVSGTAQHLRVEVHLITSLGAGTCLLVGGGPALRVAMAGAIDLTGVTMTMTERDATRTLTIDRQGQIPVAP